VFPIRKSSDSEFFVFLAQLVLDRDFVPEGCSFDATTALTVGVSAYPYGLCPWLTLNVIGRSTFPRNLRLCQG
jgi:hypothetical protein